MSRMSSGWSFIGMWIKKCLSCFCVFSPLWCFCCCCLLPPGGVVDPLSLFLAGDGRTCSQASSIGYLSHCCHLLTSGSSFSSGEFSLSVWELHLLHSQEWFCFCLLSVSSCHQNWKATVSFLWTVWHCHEWGPWPTFEWFFHRFWRASGLSTKSNQNCEGTISFLWDGTSVRRTKQQLYWCWYYLFPQVL